MLRKYPPWSWLILSITAAALILFIFPQTGSLLMILVFAIIWGRQMDNQHWKLRAAIGLTTFIVLFAIIAAATPIGKLEQRFSTQWEEMEQKGYSEKQQPSFRAGLHIFANNFVVALKIILLTALIGTAGLFMSAYTVTGIILLIRTWVQVKVAAGLSLAPLLGFITLRYLPHLALELTGFILVGRATILFMRQGSLDERIERSGRTFALALIFIIAGATVETLAPLWSSWLIGEEYYFFVPSTAENMMLTTNAVRIL